MMLCQPMEKSEIIAYASAMKGKYAVQEKFDGDRILLKFEAGKLQLLNRRGVDVKHRYPELFDFKFETDVWLDGEMCVLDQNGLSQFNEGIAFRTHCETPQAIAEASQKYPVTFVVFDVLKLGTENLQDRTLSIRLESLEQIFSTIHHKHVIMAETHYDLGETWNDVIQRGGEGVIIKELSSKYAWNKRSQAWRKVKNIKEVDLVFMKYENHPRGITLETTDGIRVVCNGFQSEEVKRELDAKGKVEVTIRHLGQTATGKYRQPCFAKLVVK